MPAPFGLQLVVRVSNNLGLAHPQEQSALKHFIGYTSQGKQYLDRVSQQRPFTNGKHKNGLHTTAAAPVSLFLRLLQQEVERLRRFADSFAEDLWMRLLATADDLCMLRLTATKLETEAQQQECLLQHQELAAQCNCIGDDLVSVDSFIQHNATACAYLAFLSDTLSSSQSSPTAPLAPESTSLLTLQQLLNAPTGKTKVPAVYKTCLTECLLGSADLDAVLIGLSDLYEQVRSVRQHISANLSNGPLAGDVQQDSKWVAPDWFSRSTTKYWVQPQHRMRVKCEIIKSLPVSIYEGERHKLAAGDSEDALRFLQQQHMQDSTLVSSVYLDDPEFQTYQSRLRREDGASVVRLRWYGPRSLRPDQKIYVEKKVHREPWTGETGYKERCGMDQKHVRQYLEGQDGPPMMAGEGSQALFLRDTQQWIRSKEQAPVLRTLCNRAAFQESSNNEVRISLDSQLHMIREGAASPKQPGDWCRDLGGTLGSGDVTHFQYDVAEVKLGIKERPQWIEALVSSGLLLRVPKFSKYLHGVASLYPDCIEAFPYWFLPADKEGYVMTPASWEEMADPTDPYLKDAAAWLFPKTEGSVASPQMQAGPKSKQLTQRFNQFLRRNKTGRTTTEPRHDSSHVDTTLSDHDGEAEVGKQQQAVADQLAGLESASPSTHGTEDAKELVPRSGQAHSGLQGALQQPQQAAAAQASSGTGPSKTRDPLAEADSLSPLPDQPDYNIGNEGISQLPLQHRPLSRSQSSASTQTTSHLPYQPNDNARQGQPYTTSSSFAVEGRMQSAASLRGQGTQGISQPNFRQQQAVTNSPAILPFTPVQYAAITPGRDDEQQRSRLSTPATSSEPLAQSTYVTTPPGQLHSPARNPEQNLHAVTPRQNIWVGDQCSWRPEQEIEEYRPGMYDGYAAVSSPNGLPQQQQQQQFLWYQRQQQQPQQHQQPLPRPVGDHIMDMEGPHLTTNDHAAFEAQHAQHAQHSMDAEQAAQYPQLAQQVPFYESSPQFMPSTLTAKLPIHARLSSKVTAFLGFPKQQPSPNDIEAGDSSISRAHNLGQDPAPPSGCSPKSALLRSGIFQNPKASDQDKPISPEQAERRARGLVRTRVEPKVFFANERTFLQWLQISVLLMLTGLSLLGGSSSSLGGSSGGSSSGSSSTCAAGDTACKASKYAGVIISPIAILFMLYALFMYKRRTVQILRRANVRYDDQSGPVMLVILLIVATLASLVLTAYGTLG